MGRVGIGNTVKEVVINQVGPSFTKMAMPCPQNPTRDLEMFLILQQHFKSFHWETSSTKNSYPGGNDLPRARH